MKFGSYLIKRKMEDVLIFPFILAGKLLAQLQPLNKEYTTFFFFPFYHTGGAENVHAHIVKAAGNADCIIFFTRKSADDRFYNMFQSAGCTIVDISTYTDNKWLYFLNLIWRGKIAAYINRQQKQPVIFNGQSNFGYKISPWIHSRIKQVELIHSFNTFSWIRLPFLPFIGQTVMISKQRIEEHILQYQRLHVPAKYSGKIQFIQNAIELPVQPCTKPFNELKVLFVGRGTPEKRPELFIEMARNLPSIQFTLTGAMPSTLLNDLPANVKATGNISDAAALHQYYCAHHLLIIPSSTEGFPIVLMEAMARGCVVLATPVGDIPYHIQPDNGFLFSSTDAGTVVSEATQWINSLDMQQLQTLSAAAIRYAFKNFDIATFNQQYKTILQP